MREREEVVCVCCVVCVCVCVRACVCVSGTCVCSSFIMSDHPQGRTRTMMKMTMTTTMMTVSTQVNTRTTEAHYTITNTCSAPQELGENRYFIKPSSNTCVLCACIPNSNNTHYVIGYNDNHYCY